MRFCNFFLILLVNFWSAKAVEVPCESVQAMFDGYVSCFMDKSTAITSDNLKISDARNENIKRLWFNDNSKIFFLPVEIHEKMPNLQGITAVKCSISTIGKKNFNKLSKLEHLNLQNNKIEKIESDTFDNLNLHEIFLDHNRIKFINGKLFYNKPELRIISLVGNVCINEHVEGIQKVQTLRSKITAQCGFEESSLLDEINISNESNLLGLKCGRFSNIGGLVIGGNETVRGEWPFLVALILTSNGKFFCGGNLISPKHVLTAAHCLHNKNERKKLEAEDVAVLIGRNDLNARYERGSTQRELVEIVMHPKWKNYTEKFDSDLSILVLNHDVRFSQFIQPVCLPKDNAIMDHFDGTVVGWGMSESGAAHENVPRQASIRAVNDSFCFFKDHNLGNIFSLTSFCAGGEGTGPCSGDSGGGFYVNFRGLWTLRGIVSAGSMSKGGFGCDVGRYNLFTKLIDFLDWIKETV